MMDVFSLISLSVAKILNQKAISKFWPSPDEVFQETEV
jgi:hypothetical protein